MNLFSKFRFLPVTIFVATMLLTVKISDIWSGVDGLTQHAISIAGAEAQTETPPAAAPQGQPPAGAQPGVPPGGVPAPGEQAADPLHRNKKHRLPAVDLHDDGIMLARWRHRFVAARRGPGVMFIDHRSAVRATLHRHLLRRLIAPQRPQKRRPCFDFVFALVFTCVLGHPRIVGEARQRAAPVRKRSTTRDAKNRFLTGAARCLQLA